MKRCSRKNGKWDSIPPHVSTDVREKIERLYSPDPIRRAGEAADLGMIGHRVVPAIPFLIGMFGDEALLVEDQRGSFRHLRYPVVTTTTCPAAQAMKALRKTGTPAIDPLVASLRSEDRIVRGCAAATLPAGS